MKFYAHNEILDKHIGVKGTIERDNFDAEVESALIGDSIRQARISKKLTQRQLGELVGVKAPQISKIESGRNLTVATIVKVLRAMDMSADLVIRGFNGMEPITLGLR